MSYWVYRVGLPHTSQAIEANDPLALNFTLLPVSDRHFSFPDHSFFKQVASHYTIEEWTVVI